MLLHELCRPGITAGATGLLPRAGGKRLVACLLAAAWMLLTAPPGHAERNPLSLDEALRLAVAQSPQLQAQRALADGLSVGIVAAGALPDPKLKVKAENVPTNTFERFTAKDFHESIKVGVMQEFPGGNTLELRTQRAEHDAARGLAAVELQRTVVLREAATAWIDLRYAGEAERKVTDQIAEARLAADVAAQQYRSGKMPQAELITLQRAVVELENRRTEFGLQVKRAEIALARYVGADADRQLGEGPDVTRLPPAVAGGFDAEDFAEVRTARTQEAIARKDAELAQAEYWPPFRLELDYAWSGRAGPVVQFEPGHGLEPFQVYAQKISFEVETGLPFFTSTRQDPRYEAKLKDLDAARAMRDETKRERNAEAGQVVVDWESAREQSNRLRGELLPLAIQRREAAVAAYRGGTGTLVAVLEARRALLGVELALIKQEQAAGRAWAWLMFAFPVAGKG